MTSFLHVLLLYLLCVCGVEAVDTVTGCPNPGGPNQHTVLENLPTGTEVIIFKNITNITLSRTESYLKVRSKGLGEFAVTVQTPYDFETLQTKVKIIHFTCVSIDGHRVESSLNIIVGNQIETPPVFGGSNITYFNIPENSPQGTKVGTLHVNATEIEPSTFVLFTLTKNNTPFSVDWPPNGVVERYRTAVISIHKPDLLDYETTTQYTLTVTARIDGTNISSSATVIVNVTDVDDLPPKFENPNGYVLTKPEAMYNQEEIIRMVAVDGDKSQKSTINYSLIRVFPETSLFHVNNGTGKVIVNGKLDRETCKNYLILVKAYQVDQPDLRIDVTTLNLTVSDVDDNPPVITPTMFEASIPENTPKGVTVLAVTATDADEGENAKFQYKIENQVNPGGFEIDNRTGILTVKNSTVLDRETRAKWTFKVFAVSTRNSSIKSNAMDVNITLLDENDNSPKFSPPNYTFTVNKTLSIPGQVGTVLATDKDESNNGVVRYHLEGKESHRFAIRDQSGSGLIEAVAALNSTYKPEYRFTVVASDMAASPYRRQSSVQVNVRVLDVNVNAPVFVNMTPNVSIKEDIDINSDVLWVQAYDEDPSDHLTFMLSNVLDFTLHKIDSRRSKIVINKALDRETTPNGYNITVKVTDSVHTSTATLSVNVEDINDNAPQFQSSTYNFTTPEEEPPRVIGHVKATDIDIQKNGMVHYTLVSPWNANFSVNKTGDIIVTSRLDRESLTSTSGKIILLVMAEDSGTPPLMTTATVIVQVEDVNDHAPLFVEKEENITIDEGSFLNTDLQAYDEDEGKNGHISYRIGSSNISLEITNGTLRSNACLTYGFYKAEIIAYNDVPYKPPAVANGTLTVNIHVEDINNHQPKFNQPNYNFSLLEDFAVGHVLSQRLSAVDKDETSAYNTVTYSIEDENSYFEVDPNNGTLRLIKPLDYEDKTQITFQVQATDGYEKHVTKVNVTVTVLDVNDNAPVFSKDIYKCSVAENSTGGLHCPFPIKAKDNDTVGNNGRLLYGIDDPLKSKFEINETTGVIHPRTPLDADTGPGVYIVTIIVKDNGSPQNSGSALVEVSVEDKNDNFPVILGPSHITIPENIPVSTSVGTIVATDLDINDTLTFSLNEARSPTTMATAAPLSAQIQGLDNDTFILGRSNGTNPASVEILVNKVLDRETSPNGYHLILRVTDSNHTSTASVSITIEDVNDNAPEFNPHFLNFTIDEGDPPEVIGHVTATDKDLDENAKLQYTVLPSWNSTFEIDQTGQIHTISALDRENLTSTSGQIALLVMAQDLGTPSLMSVATVCIKVKDVNDHAPHFNNTSMNITIVEGGNLSVPIEAYDEDEGENRNVQYIVQTNATSLEIIHGTLISTAPLTYGVYKAKIIAYNTVPYIPPDLQNGTLTVFIYVKDINDQNPQFNQTSYEFSLAEDFQVGHLVNNSHIYAQDLDESQEYNTVTYSMAGRNDYFEIDPESAALRLIKPLDYEKEKRVNFQVIASDGDIAHQVSVNVSVKVLDVNDHAPVFSSAIYNCTVFENATTSITCNLDVNATDEDDGENGIISYSIQGPMKSVFKIENSTGVISPRSLLDYDTGVRTYILKILATDNGSPRKNGSAVVEVSINDKNDNPPVIHGPSHFSIPENLSANTLIGNVFTTDVDISSVLVFSLSNNTNFHIQNDTGALFTKRKFDYEKKIDRMMEVIVTVSDGLQSDELTISVAITNVNDEIPVFDRSSLNPTISQDMDSPSFYIQATDADIDSTLSYNISSNFPHINITRSSGLVTIGGSISSLDKDIAFNVSVSDGKHIVSATATVQVIFVNDNVPRFENSTYTFDVDEEEEDIIVGQVKAIDEDLGDNGRVRYSTLPPWNSTFAINQTGQIHIIAALDRENLTSTSNEITLLVMAQDLGTPSLMSVVTVCIKVNDVNDHAPHFSNNLMNITSVEGGNLSVTIEAYDEDEGENRNVQYIVQTNATSLEIIHGTLISTAPLTYGMYEAKIIAFNTVPYIPPELENGTMTVFIYVKDINDQSPMFNQTSYEFSLAEDFQVGHLVNKSHIYAQDLDKSQEYNTVTYSMAGRNDYFEIDPESAALRLIKPLDYEKEKRVNFQVIASDGDIAHQVSVNVSVKVLDVNDHAPVFSSAIYNCTVFENATTSITCNLDVNATDEDDGKNGIISYSIQGPMKSVFKIENSTGVISPRWLLDYDTGVRTYILKILATDNGSPRKNGSAVVEVSINDKNDNPPVIHGPSHFSIPENLSANRLIGNVFATDVDISSVLVFSLSNNTNFHIQNDTGALFTKRKFDYEKKIDRMMEVIVTVSDGLQSDELTISVAITNVNDEIPVFDRSSLNPTISQDMDSPSFYIQATDADIDSTLSYNISSNFPHINITRSSGLVTIGGSISSLDKDIAFNVSVSDGKHIVSATATVQVIFVNDNVPRFENSTYTFDVDEEEEDIIVGQVKAIDEDLGDNGRVRYSTLPPWNSTFAINQTGQIHIIAALDRENLTSTSNEITLLVMAQDLGTPSLMSVVTVCIKVNDVNDHAPHFSNNLMNITSVEGGNLSVTIEAYDEDEGENRNVQYIVQTNATSLEIIHGTLISTAPLTYGMYEAKIIAFNTVPYIPPELENGTMTVFIYVKDINDQSPMFNQTSYEFSLAEDFQVGHLVNKSHIYAQDLDKSQEYNTVTYSMAGRNDYFEIDPESAALRLIKPLDYEKEKRVNFQVIASDGDIAHQVSVNVSVKVLDVNDHAPVFSSAIYNCTVFENATTSITCNLDVNATDEDDGKNGIISYSIQGPMKSVFKIENSTGVISPRWLLDYDTGVRTYILKILATDNGSPRKNGSAVVEVSINDKNDNPPVIHGPSHFSIPENLSANRLIGNVFATDVDISSVLVFSLSNNTNFHIQNDTGALFTKRKFDYEKKIDRMMEVIVTVSDGLQSDELTISVAITNVNDEIPVFDRSSLNPTISQDMDSPSFYIQATDADIDSTLSYNISSNFPHINITRSSGLVTIGGSISSLDKDIAFNVSVSDGKHIVSATATVQVIFVNDNVPRFENSTYTFDVDEEEEDIIVGQVKAIDEDLGDNGRVRYSTLPPWNSTFAINQTGQIHIIAALDRENLTSTSNEITLLVMAQDLGTPSLMSVVTVCIKVNDVNDHAPHFSNNLMNITSVEGGNLSVTIEAYDEDEGENRNVQYIVQTNATSLEIIHGTLISTAPLTYGMYEAKIIAFNTVPYIPPELENGTMTVFIYVKDINDQSPMFNQTSYEFSLAEDFQVGHLVNKSHIYAQDLDKSQEYNTVTYSMAGRNDYFEIDPESAALRLIKPLDYEKEKRVNFQVIASDGDIAHQVSVNVSVKVLDVNDHAPVFSSAIYNCTVFENATTSITCNLDVNATDEDDGKNGIISYSIQGPMKSVFKIENSTGVISPRWLLDYDTGVRTYILKILATDNGSPRKNGSAVVEVFLKDINDNPPVIHGPSHFSIEENLPANTSIGAVFATDVDISSVLVFSLDDNTNFLIQNNTGILLSTRKFDYENNSNRLIHVHVTVTDGEFNATWPISVAVTNVNDEVPVFINSSLNPTISEDMENPSFYIQATDGDMDSILFYNISSDSQISIINASGLVRIKGHVNSSATTPFEFDVSVSDGVHMETGTVTVHVTDVDNNLPRFENSTYTFDVVEEQNNIFVGNVKATDEDIDPINKQLFYMVPTLWSSNVTINSTSGDIYTVGVLDRESPSVRDDQVELIVMAVDTGSPQLTGTTLVIVSINDVNDHQPTFVQSSVSYTIAEGQCPSPLHNLTVVDKDEGKNKQTWFKIIEGTGIFNIKNNYSLECQGDLDVGMYNITIEAVNVEKYEGISTDNNIQTISVHVQDVNDHNPVFESTLYTLDLLENHTLGELYFTPGINATDADTSAEFNTVTYTIVQGNGSSYFAINHNTGRLWLKSPLDYEREKILSLTISASDGHLNINDNIQHNATADVNIHVQNINDNTPIFTSGITMCSVLENVTGEFGCKVKASDADDGDIMTYTLANTSRIFEVDSENGDILVKNSTLLDYDRGVRHFDIVVMALDKGSPQLTGSTIVSVEIQNANDEYPIFSNQTYMFEIPEEEQKQYFVGHVSATDLDDDIYGRLTFSLSESKLIQIDKTTGDIFTSVILDYENPEQRVLTDAVTASDGANSVTAIVTVSILNVNDNTPLFNSSTYRKSIRENTATGQPLIQVRAFDEDSMSSLGYSIEGGNDKCGTFGINTTSGEISVLNKTCLDYERQKEYILVIEVTDGGSPARSSQAIVEVNVTDEDDVAPSFITETSFGVVKENEPAGTSILKIFVFDPDTSFENVTLSVNNSRFGFDNWTLQTNSQLNAEDIETYFLKISVSDGVIGHMRSQLLIVNVTDVNDNTPAFNSTSYNAVIPQNARDGSYVLTVWAKDNDISNLGFTFFLSEAEGDFVINSRTGVVTVANAHAHFCVNCNYTMNVHVVDYGEPPKSNSTQIDIRIDTSNHYAPVFKDTQYTVNVSEHKLYTDSIVNVSATDADCGGTDKCGPAGTVHYTILSGNHGQFIINKTTGFIYINGSLDFKDSPDYDLVVEARDQADDFKTDTTAVRVYVFDVNERPHFVKNVTSVCSVENVKAGDLVGIVTASDPDYSSPFHKLTYTLLNQNDTFHVNATTGKIYASRNVTASSIQTVVLQFVVTDRGGLNDSTTLRLSTGTKGKPVFDKNSTYIHVKIPENTPVPVYIADVNTTTENTGDISYQLTSQGPHTKGFRIGNSTGLITATALLDREASPNIILTVTATNSAGACSSLVDIEVLDVNDQPPVFQSDQASVSVLESTPVGTCIRTVSATDRDSDPQLTFAILNDETSSFGIEKNNDSLSACVFIDSSLDFENVTNYNLTLQVNDGQFNNTMSLLVVVLDVNDNPPVFSNRTYQTSIAEDSAVSSSFYRLHATDADTLDDGKLQYTLVNDDNGQFSIQSEEGIGYVILNNHLDREVNKSYSLDVDVTDSANHTASTTLEITVLDVNDNKPAFLQDVYNLTVNEGPESMSLTIPTEARDSDEGRNSVLEYSIISQDFGHHFDINNTTGDINVLTPLNREDTPIYTLVIEAADDGDTKLSGTATVYVNVGDINDCAPEFQQTTYSASVMEGSPSGTSIIHLTAVDKDVRPRNKNVSYSISYHTDLFEVDTDGVLTLKQEIVLETNPTPYFIQVEASDGEYNTTANITISVIDVNDHDPVFNETFYRFSVPENDNLQNPPSVLVGMVSASDADPGRNGEVSYRILSSDVPVFAISKENGSIVTNGTLDRDRCVNSRYTFTVIATDGGNATRTGFVEVTVTISDINDNTPQFTSTHYDGNIIENSNVGTEVNIHPAIYVDDVDAGENGTAGIVFHMSPNSPFEINNQTGRIYVKSETLDREEQDTYNLTVTAVDRSGTGNENSSSLLITLADANDEAPIFAHNVSSFNIMENVSSSYLVGTVYTTDADITGNLTTRYDIDSGGDGHFYIDPIQGEIIVIGGLDREQKDNYTLTIRASDGHNSATAEVDIILEDANDNTPMFLSNPVVINVTESTRSLSGIYTFKAHDADLGENARLSYFINENDTDYAIFSISEDGILNTSKGLDREANDTYEFHVFAHDNGMPSLTASVTVICHVLDSNDNYPIFYDSNGNKTTEYRTFILEKSPIDSPVFFPYVRDKDLGLNSTVNFQLLGAEKDLFKCNIKTGVVTVSKRIEINALLGGNEEKNDTTDHVDISLTIKATDEGSPPKSTNFSLIVTVEQISDENPAFDHTMYNFNVSEATSNGSTVGVVTALMPNVTNYHLSYSLVIPTDIVLLDRDSGMLKLNTELDREKNEWHYFAVQVTDGKTPERTAFAMVNIHVTDVNDNPPQFQKLSHVIYVMEDTYAMSDIGTFNATDKDAGNNATIQYSLYNYTGHVFSINSSTGHLTINGTLDREENSYVDLIVQAEDEGTPPLSATAFVRVEIQDANDHSPQFQRNNYMCSVEENAPYLQICNVTATDDDMGDNGTIVYSIQDSNIPFYIDAIDGTIWKSGLVDFETKNTYNLTLEARDLGSPMRSSNVTLVITIIDVPDTAPKFTSRLYNVYMSPFTPLHTTVLNVTAGDTGITYMISNGPTNTFCIGNNTGEISLCKSMVDSQKPTYVLTVKAEDANLTDTAVVVIQMRNEPASFSQNIFSADIMENGHGGMFLDLNTTEELSGIPVHYTLISVQPPETAFNVNEMTGEVYCSGSLDRERENTYTLHVSAEVIRSGQRSKRSIDDSLGQVEVIVNVGDVNDNPPRFPTDTKTVYRVPKSLQLAAKVAELQAIDPDENSTISYRLENNSKLPFFLDGNARLRLKSTLESDSYHLTVSVTDEDGLFSDINITIITIPDEDRLTYVIPMSTQEFEKTEKALIANLSSVLGVNITIEGYKAHISAEVEPSKTDLSLFATNQTTGHLLSRDQLSSLLSSKFADIFKLFGCNGDTCYIYSTPVNHTSHVMTAPEIALLTIAVLIFVVCVLVIIAGNHFWKQFHAAREQEVKMWELESLGSGGGSQSPVTAVNPNQETAFASLGNNLATNKKGTVLYESQELSMSFDNEAFVHGPRVASGADSGVENDSSSSSNVDDNEPAVTEAYSEKTSMEKEEGTEHHQHASGSGVTEHNLSLPVLQNTSVGKEKRITLNIDMDTGATSDDDLNISNEENSSLSEIDLKPKDISDQFVCSETSDKSLRVVTSENDQTLVTSAPETTSVHSDTVSSETPSNDHYIESPDENTEEEMVTSF